MSNDQIQSSRNEEIKHKLSRKAIVNFILQSGFRDKTGVKRFTEDKLNALPTDILINTFTNSIWNKWQDSTAYSSKKNEMRS